MTRKLVVNAAVFALCFAATEFPAARAQTSNTMPEFSAERPGFTNGTETVGPRRIQLELGYLYSNGEGVFEHHLLDSSQMRFGTGKNTEVRLGLPFYATERGPDSTQHGFSDVSLSYKWRFFDDNARHPALAVIAQTSLPTGTDSFGSPNAQPQLDFEASHDLSDRVSAQANFIYTRASESGAHFNQYSGGINLQYNFSPRTSAFIETYRIAPAGADAPNQNFVDAGVTRLVARDTQLDISAGAGVSRTARGDFFVGAGVARRW